MSAAERAALLTFELGEQHYRRSEDSWAAAGSPRATIALAADERGVVVFARVLAGERHFQSAGAANAFDNESPDTMGAGVQLYARSPDASGAWMLVPEPGSDVVRVRSIAGWSGFDLPVAHWREDEDGYELRIDLGVPPSGTDEMPLDIDLIVNETTAQRIRRRGQLVLSGARGEFVYLRGDRHDAARLIPLVIVP
jgi:hypothetical protein